MTRWLLVVWPVLGGAAAPFPHAKGDHRLVQCWVCHDITPQQVNQVQFASHRSCVRCHNFAKETILAAEKFCAVCHVDLQITTDWHRLAAYPPDRRNSDFGTQFSHAAHSKDPLRCSECHVPAATDRRPEFSMNTGHAACFRCHGERANAKAAPDMYECAACHPQGGPRPPQLWRQVKEFRHRDHQWDTRPRRKGQPLPVRDALCRECHASVTAAAGWTTIRNPDASICERCHTGRPGLPDTLEQEVLRSLAGR